MNIYSQHYYGRYQRFIEHYSSQIISEGELHHIIPKCAGGTDDETNIIKLPYRAHFIAHYLLAKSTNNSKLWFAFNMMKRVCNGRSVLYEAARKYISSAISTSNRGRKRSQSVRDEISKRSTGYVVVKNAIGETFRVAVNDPRYVSGELVYYRTGSSHSHATRSKMSKNGIRGRRLYSNHLTDETIYLRDGEAIPMGFVQGITPSVKQRQLLQLRKPRSLKLVKCPHCGVEGSGGNMTRYHFSNCKNISVHA